MNILREIEAPELCIIGRWKSNDEQLANIETRIECLEGLKTGLQLNAIDEIYESIILNDFVCLLKGDGRAVAFGAGNQKGGYYFCPCCPTMSEIYDISHYYQQSMKSVKYMQGRVTEGKFES